jgi:hypothetical protein
MSTAKPKPAAKKAPAKKAAPKTEKAPAVRAATYPETAKITVLVKENPKREGSAAYGRFALYGKNRTVGAFLAAGGARIDLSYDAARGYVAIAA